MPEFEITQLAALIAALREDEPRGGEYPVGGAVAAIAAALAASLAAAAAENSRTEWEEAGGARAQALALRGRAIGLAESAASEYVRARGLLGDRALPNESAERVECQERRDWRLGAGVARAAEPLLDLAASAADIAQLAQLIAVRGADDVRPDAVVAAVLAAAAARAGARLVEVNLVVGGAGEMARQARRHAEAAVAAADAACNAEA